MGQNGAKEGRVFADLPGGLRFLYRCFTDRRWGKGSHKKFQRILRQADGANHVLPVGLCISLFSLIRRLPAVQHDAVRPFSLSGVEV